MRSCDPACSTSAGVETRFRTGPQDGRPGRRRRAAHGVCARGRGAARRAARSSRALACFSAQAISASRRPSTNSRSRLSAWLASGFTRVPAAAMSVPSGNRMSRSTTIAGSNIRLRCFPGRRDAGDRLRFLQPRPGAGPGFPLDPGELTGALHCAKPRLDLFQQVRLGDGPGRTAHAEVLRRRRSGHTEDGRQRKRRQGPERSGQAHGAAPGGGHGRTVTDPSPGSNSSGPTSGPLSPSQGRSGRAIARPRMRARGTRPISA